MRVALNAYLLHAGQDYRGAGVSTYIWNLLAHLPEVASQHEFLAYTGTDAPSLANVTLRRGPLPTWRAPVRIGWEQTVFPVQAMIDRADLVHGTVNVASFACPMPQVITLHDLSFLRHPERFHSAKVAYLREAVRMSVRRAARIIAVSDFTRQEAIALLGVKPNQVDVVYSGVDPGFRPLDRKEASRFLEEKTGGRPYILYVGTLEPRKNLDVLIRAYAALRRQEKTDHALVLAGGRGWKEEPLFRLVAGLHLQNHVLFPGYVARDQLPLWYNGADLFAYPSAYEGFGLPVLEAMACGVPVVTSASSAMTELVGDAGITVLPGSEDQLRGAMTRLIFDEELRTALATAGLKRSVQFSWQQTARQTVDVYERVLGGRGC